MQYKRRLLKELERMKISPPDGVTLITADDLLEWYLDLTILDDQNTLYYGQTFRLYIQFPDDYPVEVPQVKFIQDEARDIPLHPHIYSNGHICLDLLGTEWSPVQTVYSICLSLQSMLSSNTQPVRPEDDERYVKTAPKNPKHTKFVYHDDTV